MKIEMYNLHEGKAMKFYDDLNTYAYSITLEEINDKNLLDIQGDYNLYFNNSEMNFHFLEMILKRLQAFKRFHHLNKARITAQRNCLDESCRISLIAHLCKDECEYMTIEVNVLKDAIQQVNLIKDNQILVSIPFKTPLTYSQQILNLQDCLNEFYRDYETDFAVDMIC